MQVPVEESERAKGSVAGRAWSEAREGGVRRRRREAVRAGLLHQLIVGNSDLEQFGPHRRDRDLTLGAPLEDLRTNAPSFGYH